MGGKSSTTTQSVSIPPEVLARYNAVNARAESVAQQPFQRYGGQFVAGLTDQQQAGMANTNAAANQAQAYYSAATGTQNAAYQQGMGQTQQAYQPLQQGQQQGQYYAGRADQGYNSALSSAAPYYEQASRDITRGLGGVQGYNAAATESAMAAPGMARGMNEYAQRQIVSAQGRAQPANAEAMRQASGAQGRAQPYYDAAARGTMGASQAASPYQAAATLSALEGGQSVSPGELQTAQYMNPYTRSVADTTYQALRQQQQQEMAGQTGNAIRSGAFGGDRAGLAAAALSRQQNLATAQAMSPIYERGYQQALQTAQQQQGVNLSAEQANRAARQQQAQQLLGIGQQGYAQRMGEAQQAAMLGEKQYGMGSQTAQLMSQLGSNQYQQALGSGQAAAGVGQQLYGQGAQQAQLLSGLGGTAYQQQLAAAQQRQGIGQAQQGLYNQYGQAQQQLGQQQFAQGATTAQQQAALAQQGYGMGAQTAQQIAALGTGAQNAALQGAQAQIAAGTLDQQTRQADLTANYQQFLQERGYPFQVAQFLANIAMGTGALSGSTTTTTQPSSFFSDERLKENIHPVGETFDGQTIYRYNYKGEPGTQIGLIAQEVEQHHPDAVGRAQGFKTVDYDRATNDAAKAGLAAASMGGAVDQPGNYARGGYAPGGLVDPNDLQAILKQQQASFGPFSQAGLYGGKGGEPGGMSYVPKAGLHTPKLMVAGSAPKAPQSGMSQLKEATALGQKVFGKEGFLGKEGLGQKAFNKVQGLAGADASKPSTAPAPAASTGDAAKPAAGVAAGAPAPTEEKGWLDKGRDFIAEGLDWASSATRAEGGRIGYAGLGKVIDPMEIQDPSKGVGAYIEDATEDQTNAELAKPGQAPGQGRGPGSDIKDALGIAASIASLASFSDARLKDNIRPVGKTYDGQNIYAYDFGDGATRMGLMAQEVLDHKPEAVGESRDGFLTLDYDRATEDAVPGLAPRERADGGLVPRHAYADGGNSISDEEYAIRTIAAEAGGPEDARAIAHVINNRKNSGRWGDTYQSVVTAPSQFEPWSNPKGGNYPMRFAPDSPRLEMARKAYQEANAGEDVTGGAMHFYAPGAQAALGRKPPSWSQGKKTTDFGPTRIVHDVDVGDRPAPNAQPAAGVAPPQQAQEKDWTLRYLPTKQNEKGEEVVNWKQLAIPTLVGLGSMAASPSRYLGSAILQGLGAGAESYANLEKQQADIEGTQASTLQTLANVARNPFDATGKFVILENGSMMPINEWFIMDEANRPMLIGGKQASAMAYNLLKRTGLNPSSAGLGAASTPKEGGLSPQAPKVPEVPGATTTDGKPAEGKDGALPPVTFIGDASRRYVKGEGTKTVSGFNTEAQKEKSSKYLNNTAEMAKVANESTQSINELAKVIAKQISATGAGASGTTFNTRAEIIRALNSMSRVMGGSPLSDAATQKDLINKLNTIAGSEAARSGDQRSFAALRQMIEALPNATMEPEAQAELTAQILMSTQAAKDREIHRVNYDKLSRGLNSYADAGNAFEEDNRARYALEQNLLKKMLMKTDPKIVEAFATGKGTPRQIENFFKFLAKENGIEFVPGMYRYFARQ